MDLTHYHFCGLDLCGWLRAWSDIAWDVHTSDARFLEWRGEDFFLEHGLEFVHLPVGGGTIDFRAVAAVLLEVGYEGYWTLELYPQHVTCAADHTRSRDALHAAEAAATSADDEHAA